MRRFVPRYPKLMAAGGVGLVLFLVLYGPAFMGAVRPQPLDRNQIVLRALEFTAQEGWSAPDRIATAMPIAGATGDRESLVEPSWEVSIVTSPASIISALFEWRLPDPLVSLELTPEGDVVRYLELTTQVRTERGTGDQPQRLPPLHELDTTALFTVADEYRRTPEEGEIARAINVALAFFARHGIEVSGEPVSVEVGEGRRDSRIVNLEWALESEMPETIRVAVTKDRVAAYDRDVRGEQIAAPMPASILFLQVVQSVQGIVMLVVIALVAGMLVIRKRLGEIDFRSTMFIFSFYLIVTVLQLQNSFGISLGVIASNGGDVNFWALIAGNVVTIPVVVFLLSAVVAGAWAVGEGLAYLVWPQHLLRPFSAWMRGNFRTPEAAPQVIVG